MPHLPQVGRSRGYAGISIIGVSPRGGDFVLRPYSIKLECDTELYARALIILLSWGTLLNFVGGLKVKIPPGGSLLLITMYKTPPNPDLGEVGHDNDRRITSSPTFKRDWTKVKLPSLQAL